MKNRTFEDRSLSRVLCVHCACQLEGLPIVSGSQADGVRDSYHHQIAKFHGLPDRSNMLRELSGRDGYKALYDRAWDLRARLRHYSSLPEPSAASPQSKDMEMRIGLLEDELLRAVSLWEANRRAHRVRRSFDDRIAVETKMNQDAMVEQECRRLEAAHSLSAPAAQADDPDPMEENADDPRADPVQENTQCFLLLVARQQRIFKEQTGVEFSDLAETIIGRWRTQTSFNSPQGVKFFDFRREEVLDSLASQKVTLVTAAESAGLLMLEERDLSGTDVLGLGAVRLHTGQQSEDMPAPTLPTRRGSKSRKRKMKDAVYTAVGMKRRVDQIAMTIDTALGFIDLTDPIKELENLKKEPLERAYGDYVLKGEWDLPYIRDSEVQRNLLICDLLISWCNKSAANRRNNRVGNLVAFFHQLLSNWREGISAGDLDYGDPTKFYVFRQRQEDEPAWGSDTESEATTQ